MLGPFTISCITSFSDNLVSEVLSSESTKSGLDDLDPLWEGQEFTILIDFFLTGLILGSLFIPYLADLYGRKKIIKTFCILNAFCLMLAGLSINMPMLLIAGFALGFCFVGVYMVGIVLCVESVDFKQRAWYLGLYMLAYSMSPIVLMLFSLLAINWRVVMLMYSFLAFIEFLLLKYVAESPRFLLVNVRKIEECKKVLNKISLMNGEGPFSYSLESENNRKIIQVSIKDIYHSRLNILKLLSCSIILCTTSLAYYLSSFNIFILDIYPEIDSILMNLIIILSCVAGVHLVNSYGRKKPFLFCLLIEGALFLCISLVSYTNLNNLVPLILFLVLNFISGVISMLILIFTAEQFPTYIRCTCLGIVTLTGRLATIIAANMDYLGGDNLPVIYAANAKINHQIYVQSKLDLMYILTEE